MSPTGRLELGRLDPTRRDIVDALMSRPPDQGITLALAVSQGGRPLVERFGVTPDTIFGPGGPVDATTPLLSWSTAKSMTHAALGIAVDDGLIDLDAPAPVAEWRDTEREAIRVIDLLEMHDGLRFAEDYVDGETSDVIDMLFAAGADDHASYAASRPLEHPPGTVWNYSSGTTNILCRILGEAIGGGAEGTQAFLRERLFEPAGMLSAEPGFDPAGTWVGSSYVHAVARDFVRFGELYLRDGVVADRRVLPPGWLDHARTVVAHDPAPSVPGGFGYGRHWWTWPEFPGSLAAHGYEGQYVVVVPDRELVIAHLGKTDASVRHHVVAFLHELVLAS